jgi:hypothetical protein
MNSLDLFVLNHEWKSNFLIHSLIFDDTENSEMDHSTRSSSRGAQYNTIKFLFYVYEYKYSPQARRDPTSRGFRSDLQWP